MIRDELASFSCELTFDSLPDSVVVEVERLLLDHVASMLAGPRVFSAELPPLPAMAADEGGVAESSIVGLAGRYPCTTAAFTNTAMGFTGIDAWHKPSTLHVPAETQKNKRKDAKAQRRQEKHPPCFQILTSLRLSVDPWLVDDN